MEHTIAEFQQKMFTGELSSLQITVSFLERIHDLDAKINSVIELNPDAQGIAAELDAERAAGRVRSPLHGLPFLIKDNIDTSEKMQTTAGSLALEGNFAPRDAFIVRQLRKAAADDQNVRISCRHWGETFARA